ncbi:hypothetical protein MTO96_018866 [Rhipicephalus appendiculatus]
MRAVAVPPIIQRLGGARRGAPGRERRRARAADHVRTAASPTSPRVTSCGTGGSRASEVEPPYNSTRKPPTMRLTPVAAGCRASAAAVSGSIQVRRRDPGLHRCGRALSVRRGRRALPRGFLRPAPSPGDVGHATSDTCAPPRTTNVATSAVDGFEEPSAVFR